MCRVDMHADALDSNAIEEDITLSRPRAAGRFAGEAGFDERVGGYSHEPACWDLSSPCSSGTC